MDEVAPLIDAMLRSEILLKASVIHERLALEYGVTINYQRVKIYLQKLAGLHRRFEVIPGAQAQCDWGDEGQILAHVGVPKVYSGERPRHHPIKFSSAWLYCERRLGSDDRAGASGTLCELLTQCLMCQGGSGLDARSTHPKFTNSSRTCSHLGLK